ncbi:MAG TPA: 1,4-beta-xylanase [Patescibacteria group bacterium]|nr:1,4-beta-xylanase [Patescibacteria group bacterium]
MSDGQPRKLTDLWTQQAANAWYAAQPYLKGANYLPASAINQLEMWQADTFDPDRIDRELGWAEDIGMNTMRVFLHDLLWQQDPEGFKDRINQFLAIADLHHIKPMFVLFDSCWDPHPQLGRQKDPTPGVHNSGWVQGPGSDALLDRAQYPRLRAYVEGVVSAFANDPRVLAWDVWNEPDNINALSYGPDGSRQEPGEKLARVEELLPQVFDWARTASPQQPLTSGVWVGDWSEHDRLPPIQKTQLSMSDVVSFHNYDSPAEFEKRIRWLQRYERPILCTEYMARGQGNRFDNILPLAKQFNVAAINWGFVAGKSQTYLPWDSWQKPYVNGREPDVWFHDIFHEDGTPYRPAEIPVLKNT